MAQNCVSEWYNSTSVESWVFDKCIEMEWLTSKRKWLSKWLKLEVLMNFVDEYVISILINTTMKFERFLIYENAIFWWIYSYCDDLLVNSLPIRFIGFSDFSFINGLFENNKIQLSERLIWSKLTERYFRLWQ